MTRRARLASIGSLAFYTLFVLLITLWPQRVDKPIDHQLRSAINSAHDAGAPRHLGYSLIQNVSNAALFLPLGVLIALAIAHRLWWVAPLLCAGLSTVIELAQHLFLPNRFGSVTDVVSNSLGALIGALIVYLAIELRHRRGTHALTES